MNVLNPVFPSYLFLSDASHPSHGMDYDTMYRELQEHRAQSQNLSKLLLKKQGAVLELQAERSALKSRLVDLQTR